MPSAPVCAAVLATLIVVWAPQSLAAQSTQPAAWKNCSPPIPTTGIVLGGRRFAADGVRALGTTPITLGSLRAVAAPPESSTAIKPAAPGAGQPAQEPPKSSTPAPTERLFCLEPVGDVFPQRGASQALVLLVAATTDLTFLRVAIYRGTTLVVAADGPAAQHSLLIGAADPTPASGDQMLIVVSREDAGQNPAAFTAQIQVEPLVHDSRFQNGSGWFVRSLSEGQAFRFSMDLTVYNRLLTFARCDWLSHDARLTSPAAGCFESQMAALKNEIYPLVSRLIGRSPSSEFAEGQPRASLSEPMVVFFGLGGTNKMLLLDCRDTGNNVAIDEKTAPTRGCSKYAEPWQTTLQRARYVWAVYIEDEQTPFNTSIDVEFKPRAPSVDYEEYDPLGLAYPQVALAASQADGKRLVRVGYRRLRIREPPVAVQVAFSRSGPNYGLRQWVRVYRQFSARWWVVSGGVFVPADDNSISHIESEQVFPLQGGPATLARIVDEQPPAPVFATFLWRWPQVRGRADNQAQANKRLLVNLIPDVIAGLSLPARRHNSYLIGGSWPILVDRVSFVAGARIFRDEHPAEGLAVGQLVPADMPVEAVRDRARRHADLVFGLAIELVRSR